MASRHLIAFFIQALLAGQVFGADRVWIVGGGPASPDSQAQIERNVKWEREGILRQAPMVQLRTFFNGGTSMEKDVVEWRHPAESVESLQPLARVFGTGYQNGERYYQNTILGVEGTTRVDELVARLRNEFAQMRINDKALFIFYGHGSRNSSDAAGNALRLWGDTQLTARDLGMLLAEINTHAPVRFFLPQCFSGGFARMIYSRAPDTRTSKVQNIVMIK